MDKPFVLYSSGLMYDYKKTKLLNLYLSSLISSSRVLPCLNVLSVESNQGFSRWDPWKSDLEVCPSSGHTHEGQAFLRSQSERRLFSDGFVLKAVWSQSNFTGKASSGSCSPALSLSLTHTVFTNVWFRTVYDHLDAALFAVRVKKRCKRLDFRLVHHKHSRWPIKSKKFF